MRTIGYRVHWSHPAGDLPTCDHNCVPCSRWFRRGWLCVRCLKWSRTVLPRRPDRHV